MTEEHSDKSKKPTAAPRKPATKTKTTKAKVKKKASAKPKTSSQASQKKASQKKASQSRTSEEVKAAILAAALKDIPFDGWVDKVLRTAAEREGVPVAEMRLLYPRGAIDLLEDFSHWADDQMVAALEAADLASMKIRERITFAVRARIEALQKHREASVRAASLLALPLHSLLTARLLARTMDLAWRGIGDTSTDINFYTKRATLSLVYSTTLMVWITDQSDDLAETFAFLDRRIENVMQFEKFKAKVKAGTEKWPDPAKVLARLLP